MDGLDRKMIFKFGKHLERLHSTHKQCRRIHLLILRSKILVGKSQTLFDLHRFGAGCAIALLKITVSVQKIKSLEVRP